MLRVLHTSDWHIGRSLYGKNRYAEFAAFLEWLVAQIVERHIDVLLISGDVFDTTTPSNKAQELYYFFLARIAETECRKVIVIAGNHDSPTFLDASRPVLKALEVDVIGYPDSNYEAEIIEIKDRVGSEVELVVCAVPYLRERDIVLFADEESIDDRAERVNKGIIEHYKRVCELACERSCGAPVIAMGHMFTAGAKAVEGTGVRELYVGSLAHLNASLLPENIDYYALGHLHMPQSVGGKENIRYSGSPLAMGFGESEQKKVVLQLEFQQKDCKPIISEIDVPVFQQLKMISGDLNDIQSGLSMLKKTGDSVWVEVEYTGKEFIGDLHARVEEMVADTQIEVRRIRNNRVMEVSLQQMEGDLEVDLDQLNDLDIFKRRLADSGEISPETEEELLIMYKQIRNSILERDINAV